MGIMNAVKGIIDRLRAAGKTENEISSIIQEASAKATANETINKKREYKTPEIKVAESTERMKEALTAAEITLDDATRAMKAFEKKQETAMQRDTNNWRRMHGLPMKRRLKRNGKRKRADSHPKDADVSRKLS